jgi:hypothetical protein
MAMAFKALVYLQRPGATSAAYIGQKQLLVRPEKNAHIVFEHEGRMETGRIDMFAPDDWEARGISPTINVIQRPGV